MKAKAKAKTKAKTLAASKPQSKSLPARPLRSNTTKTSAANAARTSQGGETESNAEVASRGRSCHVQDLNPTDNESNDNAADDDDEESDDEAIEVDADDCDDAMNGADSNGALGGAVAADGFGLGNTLGNLNDADFVNDVAGQDEDVIRAAEAAQLVDLQLAVDAAAEYVEVSLDEQNDAATALAKVC